jgi:IS30 family transposase
VPGHWEGDLLFGSKNSQIATLVERQSRYVMLTRFHVVEERLARWLLMTKGAESSRECTQAHRHGARLNDRVKATHCLDFS